MNSVKSKKIYEARADIMKALAHPLRLEMIDLLSKKEFCVEDIARQVEAERSNVSRHLSVLAGAGIVESRKEGLKVFYSLKVPCVLNFFGCVEQVLLQQLKEKEALLK
jgi:ArsR family transcriptional regulator